MSGPRRAAERIERGYHQVKDGWEFQLDLGGIIAIIEEETALRWTKIRPTKEGWYWYHSDERGVPVVTWISQDGWQYHPGRFGTTMIANEKWAGPIKAPK